MFSADATVLSIVSHRPAFTSIRFLVNIFPSIPVCFTLYMISMKLTKYSVYFIVSQGNKSISFKWISMKSRLLFTGTR